MIELRGLSRSNATIEFQFANLDKTKMERGLSITSRAPWILSGDNGIADVYGKPPAVPQSWYTDTVPLSNVAAPGRPWPPWRTGAYNLSVASMLDLEAPLMLDTQTHGTIRISTDGDAGPYIMVPVSQLDKLRTLLTVRGISHWVESGAISLDGRPEIAIVNLGRGADVARIQALLDQVS